MTGDQMLHHVAGMIAERGAVYGGDATSMATVAARWSITLGHPVTPAEVVLCLISRASHTIRRTKTASRTWLDTPRCCPQS